MIIPTVDDGKLFKAYMLSNKGNKVKTTAIMIISIQKEKSLGIGWGWIKKSGNTMIKAMIN